MVSLEPVTDSRKRGGRMASWMIHLRVADLLMDRIPGLDETAFVMGNIAPDSGVPNADWTAYSPPKTISHYKTRREDETFFDIERFLKEYLTPEQIRTYSRREFSFFLEPDLIFPLAVPSAINAVDGGFHVSDV